MVAMFLYPLSVLLHTLLLPLASVLNFQHSTTTCPLKNKFLLGTLMKHWELGGRMSRFHLMHSPVKNICEIQYVL